jgi:hypothetical protein
LPFLLPKNISNVGFVSVFSVCGRSGALLHLTKCKFRFGRSNGKCLISPPTIVLRVVKPIIFSLISPPTIVFWKKTPHYLSKTSDVVFDSFTISSHNECGSCGLCKKKHTWQLKTQTRCHSLMTLQTGYHCSIHSPLPAVVRTPHFIKKDF